MWKPRFFLAGILIFSFCLSFPFLQAQNNDDAIRYGQTEIGGSARFIGMSGSFGALGADPSGASVNPGGWGVFRRGMSSAGLAVTGQSHTTEHYGSTKSASGSGVRLSHLDVVFSGPFQTTDFKGGTFAFGYKNKNDFYSHIVSEGVNNESSYLDRYLLDVVEEPGLFVEDIVAYFPFGAGLAWGAELLDTANGEYYHANPWYGQVQGRREEAMRGMSDFYLGAGTNFQNKLYLGATLGFSSIRYQNKWTYYEILPEDDTNSVLRSWKEVTELSTAGTGFYFKLGAIFHLSKQWRAGLAFNSQERFRLSDNYTARIDAHWKNKSPSFAESPKGYNQYRYYSPYKFVGSLAWVRYKVGSVNLDVEYVDYTSMRYASTTGFEMDFSDANTEIDTTFQATFNYRLGSEWVFGPLSWRVGGSYWGNPYRQSGKNRSQWGASVGVGYKYEKLFFDLGYSFARRENSQQYLHYSEGVKLEPTRVDRNFHQVVLTFGFRFEEYL
ncbi:hypothetical protein KFE98_11680 [bacterium SCSIO 12741]|nr:hypothetical protein KFE98_11680 [bacterium SCSIO 12741]